MGVPFRRSLIRTASDAAPEMMATRTNARLRIRRSLRRESSAEPSGPDLRRPSPRPNNAPRPAPVGAPRPSSFLEYNTTESLFVAPTVVPTLTAPERALSVLGLTRSATWAEVTTRHRSLMKDFHPDRHVQSDDATRAHVELRVREINEAYGEIRAAEFGR